MCDFCKGEACLVCRCSFVVAVVILVNDSGSPSPLFLLTHPSTSSLSLLPFIHLFTRLSFPLSRLSHPLLSTSNPTSLPPLASLPPLHPPTFPSLPSACNRWFGKCWYVHNLLKYEFNVEFEVTGRTQQHSTPQRTAPHKQRCIVLITCCM